MRATELKRSPRLNRRALRWAGLCFTTVPTLSNSCADNSRDWVSVEMILRTQSGSSMTTPSGSPHRRDPTAVSFLQFGHPRRGELLFRATLSHYHSAVCQETHPYECPSPSIGRRPHRLRPQCRALGIAGQKAWLDGRPQTGRVLHGLLARELMANVVVCDEFCKHRLEVRWRDDERVDHAMYIPLRRLWLPPRRQ